MKSLTRRLRRYRINTKLARLLASLGCVVICEQCPVTRGRQLSCVRRRGLLTVNAGFGNGLFVLSS